MGISQVWSVGDVDLFKDIKLLSKMVSKIVESDVN